jgi:murein DD-endopeptidase MepM/ murein hydrolase activator NlpD
MTIITLEGGFRGPSIFRRAGPAETIIVFTPSGNVTFIGGVILTDETNLPADETTVFATASTDIGADPSFSDSINIVFQNPITNFSLDVINGETSTVTYKISDNLGDSKTVTLPPNSLGGQALIGFSATNATSITVTPISGLPRWDFSVDNLSLSVASGYDPTIVPGGRITQNNFGVASAWDTITSASLIPAGHANDLLTHPAADITAPLGTEVDAFASGNVVEVSDSAALGWYVRVHDLGSQAPSVAGGAGFLYALRTFSEPTIGKRRSDN